MHPLSHWPRLAAAASVALLLSACAGYPGQTGHGYPRTAYPTAPQPVTSYPVPAYPATSYPVQQGGGMYGQMAYGQIAHIETVRVQDSSGIGAGGAIVGGVVGGVLGRQVGKGTGRDLATIAGVVGGALAGNAVQNNMGGSVRDIYRVTVQLQDGSQRSFDYPNPPPFRIGDNVRVDGNQIYR